MPYALSSCRRVALMTAATVGRSGRTTNHDNCNVEDARRPVTGASVSGLARPAPEA